MSGAAILPSLGVIDEVASLVEEWGWEWVALFRRICYPPAWSMRIYYPINDEEPTPALPKGGSLNERLPTPRRGNDTSAQGIALRAKVQQ